MSRKVVLGFISALTAVGTFAYETPADARFPYVSTYYVQPVVSPSEDTEIGFFVTDWNNSKVRFGDDSHRFTAHLTYSADLSNWTSLTQADIGSGDHTFNLGHLPSGDYRLGIWVEDEEGRPSHTVWHEFRSRTAEETAIREEQVWRVSARDIADYGLVAETNRYAFFAVEASQAAITDKTNSAAMILAEMRQAAARATVPTNTYAIFAPSDAGKLMYRGWKMSAVAYGAGYDHDAVEAEAANNSERLQRLLNDAAARGCRKLVFLPGVYRVSGYSTISVPSGLTFDLNGATIKMNGCTGSKGQIFVFTHTHDTHLVNGTVEGDYYEHDYAGSPDNSEWVCGISLEGDCRYCSVEDVTVRCITGYGVCHGTRAYDHTFCSAGSICGSNYYSPGALRLADGTVDETATNRFTSSFKDISKMTSGYLMVSKYLGYQGIRTKSWYYLAAFYDSGKRYLGGTVAFQYRNIPIPAGAKYLRITVETETADEANTCELSVQHFKMPWNSAYRRLTIDRCRCVGMATSAMRNFLIEDCDFSYSGDTSATCAFDAEDGWDMMQDVWIHRNRFHDNPNNEFLTCAGHNFIVEDNEAKIHLYARTCCPCVRGNTCATASFLCDTSRNRTMHGRYERNRIRDSLSLGRCNVDIGWDICCSDDVFSYEGKQLSFAPSRTGRIRDCTVTNAKLTSTVAAFDNVTFTNVNIVGTTGTNDFRNCRLLDCHLQHFNLRNSFDDCLVRNTHLTGMSGGALSLTDCRFENFYAEPGYWSKPITIDMTRCSVANDDKYFFRPAAYTVGRITVCDCDFQTGSSPAFEIFDLRPQDTDNLDGHVTISCSACSEGGFLTHGGYEANMKKHLEIASLFNLYDGAFVRLDRFLPTAPEQWTVTMVPGMGSGLLRPEDIPPCRPERWREIARLIPAVPPPVARYTSQSYAKGSLYAQWDAIENAGVGRHVGASKTWVNLADSSRNATYQDGRATFGENRWTSVTKQAKRHFKLDGDAASWWSAQGTDYTYEAFVTPRSEWQTAGNGAAIMGAQGTSGKASVSFGQNSGTSFGFGVIANRANDGRLAVEEGEFAYGGPLHLAYVRTAKDATLYLDGEPVRSAECLPVPLNETVSFMIGKSKTDGGTFGGDIHAVRVYARALSGQEVAKNYRVDSARYFNVRFEDRLTVTGQPADVADVSPAYGTTNGISVGATFRCSAPPVWTNDLGTVCARCTGYVVYTNGVVCLSGAGNEFTYVHPDCDGGAKLVWQWTMKSRVVAEGDGHGAVRVSGDGWFLPGETATVTAIPAAGYGFGRWTVGVDAAQQFEPTLRLIVGTEPVELATSFRRKIYVAADGSDARGGTSWDDALATISAALEKGGDEPYVEVGEGLYPVDTAIVVEKPATVAGCGKRGAVVRLSVQPAIDSNATRAVFYVNNAAARLTNLAAIGGGAQRGRGICLMDGQVDDCAITNNVTPNLKQDGGGIYMEKGVVRNCLIANNTCSSSGGGSRHGGGVYMKNGLVEGCTVEGNRATSGSPSCGGGIYVCAGTVRNCLIAGNAAASVGAGASLVGTGETVMENCTIAGNDHATSSTCAGLQVKSAKVTVRNTIVRNNSNATGELNVSTDGKASLERVCTTAEVAGMGVVSGDPAFVDAANGDWRIGYGACVDAGVDAGWMATATDLAGNARVSGRAVDLGCYEFVSDGRLACGFDVMTDGALDVSEVTLTGSVIGAAAADVTFSWKVTDSAGRVTERSGKGLAVAKLAVPAGFYSVRLAVGTANASAVIERANVFTVCAKDIYVSPEGGNAIPYADFATAATNVVEALALAGDGSTVHLSDGIHRVAERVVLSKAIRVDHEGLRADCRITGNTGDCLVLMDHAEAVLANLDVSGHYPPLTPNGETGTCPKYSYSTLNGVRINGKGGTVTNCIVESCFGAISGAGVKMSAGLLVDSLIRNNFAYSSGGGGCSGAGVCLDAGRIERCLVTNNVNATGSVSKGGGVCLNGGVMRNSVIAGNWCVRAGGVQMANSSAMENCTVVDNRASTAGLAGGAEVGSKARVVNTILWNNVNVKDQARIEATGEDISFDTCWLQDPLFAPIGAPWRPRAESPCRNAGKRIDWMDGATDFRGNPRLRGRGPDIGAVEVSPQGLSVILR